GLDDAVGANVKIQLGLGTGADPAAWTWTDAIPNASYGPGSPGYEANNDEYQATFAIAGAAGTTLSYAYRLSNDGGTTWLYGDTGRFAHRRALLQRVRARQPGVDQGDRDLQPGLGPVRDRRLPDPDLRQRQPDLDQQQHHRGSDDRAGRRLHVLQDRLRAGRQG